MRAAGWTTIVYAILVLSGGIFGFAKAGSVPSLFAGLIFGMLLLLSGLGLILRKRWVTLFSLVFTLILDGFFTYRFLVSFSFMPAGMMALVSLFTLILQVYFLRLDLLRN